MKLHKLYVVEWVDSVQPVAGWHALDDLPELAVDQALRRRGLDSSEYRLRLLSEFPNYLK